MTVIMRDAIKPNLLQTLENTGSWSTRDPSATPPTAPPPCSRTLIAIHCAIPRHEAGFGADMGAERFFNIKCRTSGLAPDAAVVVTTVRALRRTRESTASSPAALRRPPEGEPDDVMARSRQPRKQVENIQLFGVTPVVASIVPGDHPSEHRAIRELAERLGVRSP